MKSRGRRYWRNLFVFFFGVLSIGLVFTFYGLLPIQFARGVAHPKRAPVCCVTPADWGLAYENVSFVSGDGVALKGWYIPSGNGAAVILSHGIGGNRLSLLEQGALPRTILASCFSICGLTARVGENRFHSAAPT